VLNSYVQEPKRRRTHYPRNSRFRFAGCEPAVLAGIGLVDRGAAGRGSGKLPGMSDVLDRRSDRDRTLQEDAERV